MPDDREPAQTSTRKPDAVPHDPQDQQASPDDTGSEDHWDVPTPGTGPDEGGSETAQGDVPETDEAGTGRRGEQQNRPSTQPEPQEPSG
ncbi:hypothetical protein QIS99_16765 [Streptomyces sp. B-S-A8]|uniref:Uncharacterized protein n=1 Tax=Streptomyces solicavernae TaxID=3043614 RepID=A0ABT6RTT5_9ACTN|nr:hypothetical protein [Streptomyces sp. B-S-A8]MDI3387839.1 hypothetical protein [Streptomyces sp. B-S-A8]